MQQVTTLTRFVRKMKRAGYTYDAKEVEVAVAKAITDDGQGQLVANATYFQKEGFTNTYKAAATSLVVKASKN